jgi:hypothetical protein
VDTSVVAPLAFVAWTLSRARPEVTPEHLIV